jgi:hypothetical protein
MQKKHIAREATNTLGITLEYPTARDYAKPAIESVTLRNGKNNYSHAKHERNQERVKLDWTY